MPDMDESPLESAVGAVDPETVEAFKLVGNEIRLAILLVLWKAYDRPDATDNAVSFTRLFEQFDYGDRGNFRYHLRQLEGEYVRRTSDDGYELRHTGLKLVQTVVGGAGVTDTELEPIELDRPCELCGAPTAVCYEDGIVFHVCTDCEGQMSVPEFPDGYLNSVALHPAGVIDRAPEDLFAAAEIAAYHQLRTMFQGLCGTCSGPIDAQLELCSEHDPDGKCERCGRTDVVLAVFQCRVCKDSHAAAPSVLCAFHPAVIAFYYEHGVATRWHAEGFKNLSDIGKYDPVYKQEIISDDPPRVAVAITLAGDELRLTFDKSVTVIDVSR